MIKLITAKTLSLHLSTIELQTTREKINSGAILLGEVEHNYFYSEYGPDTSWCESTDATFVLREDFMRLSLLKKKKVCRVIADVQAYKSNVPTALPENMWIFPTVLPGTYVITALSQEGDSDEQ